MKRSIAIHALLAMLRVVFGAPGSARADDQVATFYQGKTINLMIGYGPGGGYDLLARLLARHMGKYIPGNPNIVAQNMIGAGSLAAANYIYSLAPRDGSVFGEIGSDVPLLGLLGTNNGARFDPRKFTWIGSSSSFANDAFILLVRGGAPAETLSEATRPDGPPLILGGSGTGGRSADMPRILRDVLGLNMKQVLSYPNSPALILALERGEIDGRMFDYSEVKAIRPQWLEPASGYKILIQAARATRHPELPDIPTARELAPIGSPRELVEFAETPILTMSRPFMAPPAIPADRAGALRAAFDAVHRDPRFREEAAKIGLDISPVTGQEIADSIEKMSRVSPATFDAMKKLMSEAD